MEGAVTQPPEALGQGKMQVRASDLEHIGRTPLRIYGVHSDHYYAIKSSDSVLNMDFQQEVPQLGYRRLAKLMSSDKNLAIFRRFDDLNILSLLSLQADIIDLRHKYYTTSHFDDVEGTTDEKAYAASFLFSRTQNSEQHRLLGEIQDKLITYSKLHISVQAPQLTMVMGDT